MFTIIYSLFGAAIGVFIGYLGTEFWACLTCSTVNKVGNGMMYICAMIGLAIGAISGGVTDSDRKKAKNRAIENAIKEIDDKICLSINNIERNFGANVDYNKIYENVFDIFFNANSNDRFSIQTKDIINKNYNTRIYQHKKYMESRVCDLLSSVITVEDARLAIEAIQYLKALDRGNKRYDIVINKLYTVREKGSLITVYAKEHKYGEWKLDISEFIASLSNSGVDAYENEISNVYNSILRNDTGYFEGIVNYLPDNITEKSALLMWYHAMNTPFDVKAFNRAVDLYNKFTVTYYTERNEVYKYPKLEVLLARLYAVNKMGGENAVAQEMTDVRAWVNKTIQIGFEKTCWKLASALSWMELYKYEKEVLAELVKCHSQLSPEMQERYSFLMEGGESVKAKVYSVKNTDELLYDSSATEWDLKDYDMFFRKVGMKKMELNYSLVVDKWKKTLPLLSGQKVSKEQIHNEFMKLVADYDGEVVCKTINARAINLTNIEDEGAELFEFVGKRNKCVSILFSSEKYGRNLNLTILTLFTPSNEFSNDELKTYALSIKENMYIDSFIESIRQAIDEVIKEKKEIYEEKSIFDDDNKKAKFFE